MTVENVIVQIDINQGGEEEFGCRILGQEQEINIRISKAGRLYLHNARK